jgi:hypothetical protein
MMSYIRILYQVNQKYRYMTEATIIPLCRTAKIKIITEFNKEVRKSKVLLGRRPHPIRMHPVVPTNTPFYHGNVASDILLVNSTSSQCMKLSWLNPCTSLLIRLNMSRYKSVTLQCLLRLAVCWERAYKVPLNFHTKWSL